MAGGRYVNPANAITASRYLLLPPFLYWMDSGQVQYAWTMVVLSAILDNLDGPAARYFNCSSGFGALLDAITDAICYGFYVVVAAYYGLVPAVPIAGFVILGVANAVFRAMYAKRAGRTINFRSWAMERMVGFTAALAGLAVTGYSAAFFAWSTFVIMFVVVAWDAKRMLIDPIPEEVADVS